MLIDVRERELLAQTSILLCVSKQLPIGDIWLGLSGEEVVAGSLIIERKTIRDFEASVLDGRYREQRGRLVAYCQEVGATPMYIIEGRWTGNSGRISSEALMKLAARTQCKHGIPIMQTADVAETAVLISALDEYIRVDRTNLQRETGVLRATDSIHVVKKANAADPRFFAVSCLCQCSGVSTKVAEAILDARGGSLAGVMSAGVTDLAAVSVGKKKVGPAVATRLWGLLHASGVATAAGGAGNAATGSS
jgi:ERCC4-type nuclease